KINFFIQAEDGIRYYHVTGVQTCALPIFRCTGINEAGRRLLSALDVPHEVWGAEGSGGPDEAAFREVVETGDAHARRLWIGPPGGGQPFLARLRRDGAHVILELSPPATTEGAV